MTTNSRIGFRDSWMGRGYCRQRMRVGLGLLVLQAVFAFAAVGASLREPSGSLNSAAPDPGAPVNLWKTESFMTSLYDVSLGLTTVFLLSALGWSVLLRRRIREQTGQIRAQMEREASLELKYRDLFENANDMVFSQDISGNLASLNKAGERILACSRERARQLNLKSFVVPHQAESFDQWLGDCLAGKASQSYELEMVASDGRPSIVELSTRLLKKDGRVQGLEGIGRDITERRRAEEALRQSEERFSSAFRLSPVAIAISTLAEGRHLDVNESFLRMFGFQREEVINRTAAELGLWADPEDQARVEGLLRTSRSVSGVECKFRAKSTGVRSTLVFVERIDLRDTACALSIIHDMTDRIKLEAQLRNAMKMEAVGRLAAGVAHDFNNLLTVIQGNAEVSLAGRSIDGPSAKSFERISEAAQKAANLTRQLLTFSRKQNIQPKPLDLNEVILGAAKMFKHLLRDDILLNFKFASNLPIIEADLTMIEQVVMNLVVNARDAMPKGGEIRIGTDFVDVDKAHRTLTPTPLWGISSGSAWPTRAAAWMPPPNPGSSSPSSPPRMSARALGSAWPRFTALLNNTTGGLKSPAKWARAPPSRSSSLLRRPPSRAFPRPACPRMTRFASRPFWPSRTNPPWRNSSVLYCAKVATKSWKPPMDWRRCRSGMIIRAASIFSSPISRCREA